ncbi:hypothetical protein BJV74DRAFT_895153 [Russula compacta]|nr:hypothetical protein BJV74DRAFT_895153 [Russula compacta]
MTEVGITATGKSLASSNDSEAQGTIRTNGEWPKLSYIQSSYKSEFKIWVGQIRTTVAVPILKVFAMRGDVARALIFFATGPSRSGDVLREDSSLGSCSPFAFNQPSLWRTVKPALHLGQRLRPDALASVLSAAPDLQGLTIWEALSLLLTGREHIVEAHQM